MKDNDYIFLTTKNQRRKQKIKNEKDNGMKSVCLLRHLAKEKGQQGKNNFVYGVNDTLLKVHRDQNQIDDNIPKPKYHEKWDPDHKKHKHDMYGKCEGEIHVHEADCTENH